MTRSGRSSRAPARQADGLPPDRQDAGASPGCPAVGAAPAALLGLVALHLLAGSCAADHAVIARGGHEPAPEAGLHASESAHVHAAQRLTALVDAPLAESTTSPRLATAARQQVAWATRAASRLAAPFPEPVDSGATQRRLARKRSVPVRSVMLAVGDGEPVAIELFDPEGVMRPVAWRQAAELLEIRPVARLHPRLLTLLYLIARDFDRPIRVVSAQPQPVAAPQTATAHVDGEAVDLFVPDVSTLALRNYCLERFDGVGVGYRPRAGLVHLDLRAPRLAWTDTARAGQRSRERLDADPGPLRADPTLRTPHLTQAQLFPTRARPRPSKLVPEKKLEKRKGKKRKGKASRRKRSRARRRAR